MTNSTESISTTPSLRIDWIDVAKGITILLVIFGHGNINPWFRGAIFSFHMPLFFILSIMTYKLSQNNDEFVWKTEKSFTHLILPAVAIHAFGTAIGFVMFYPTISNYNPDEFKSYLANIILVFVAGSGAPTRVGATEINLLGIPWFLITMFFGRGLFDYCHLKLSRNKLVLASCFCSVLGLILGRIQWLPFSFDITLAIQPLFLFGYAVKKRIQNDIDMYPPPLLFLQFLW